MKKKVKSHVDKKEAIDILKKYHKKVKLENYKTYNIEEVLNPYYLINNSIEIKRAFGLKPKVIKHLYWVDAVDGSMLRTKDTPELEKVYKEEIISPELEVEKCIELAKNNAFKHVMRFYKSFWTPKVQVDKIVEVYLPFWKFKVNYYMDEDINKEKVFYVNSFSGKITKKKGKDYCISKIF